MMGKPNEKKVVVVLMRQQWPYVSQRPRIQDEEDDPAEDSCGNLGRTHARVNQADAPPG